MALHAKPATSEGSVTESWLCLALEFVKAGLFDEADKSGRVARALGCTKEEYGEYYINGLVGRIQHGDVAQALELVRYADDIDYLRQPEGYLKMSNALITELLNYGHVQEAIQLHAEAHRRVVLLFEKMLPPRLVKRHYTLATDIMEAQF